MHRALAQHSFKVETTDQTKFAARCSFRFQSQVFFHSFLFAPTFDTLSEFATEMKVQLALGHMKTVSD